MLVVVLRVHFRLCTHSTQQGAIMSALACQHSLRPELQPTVRKLGGSWQDGTKEGPDIIKAENNSSSHAVGVVRL
jgi:hypothetical protein